MTDNIIYINDQKDRERHVALQGIKNCLMALSEECISYNLQDLAELVCKTAEAVPETDAS